MVTVRFPPELSQLVDSAAARQGETESEFIREAVADRAAKVLSEDVHARLSAMIGAVASSEGSGARDAAELFSAALAQQHGQ